jgi:beta-glucosidase
MYTIRFTFYIFNGVPACANKNLLTNILREEWGFKGYVVSDMGALNNMINKQFFFNTSIETAAAAIKAGCNLELSWYEDEIIYDSIGKEIVGKDCTYNSCTCYLKL